MCGLGQNGTQEPPALSFLTPLFGPVVCDPVASLLGQQASAGTLDPLTAADSGGARAPGPRSPLGARNFRGFWFAQVFLVVRWSDDF